MIVHPVVLAGGQGTRLWPLSRSDRPKQFQPLFGGQSLFQRTVCRHLARPEFGRPWIICGEEYRFAVRDELQAIGAGDAPIVLEPMARNTAPAIAAMAELVARSDPDAVLLVLPSDHLVAADAAYFEGLAHAVAAARSGAMVTFGVAPTYPETGYGYIARGEPMGEGVYRVARFVEKPPAHVAAQMIAAGGHYWNAGFFAFGARALLTELGELAPDVVAGARKAAVDASTDLGFVRLERSAFEATASISIDYALFERTDRAAVTPLAVAWSDVGSWRAFWDAAERDERGLATKGDVLAIDTSRSLVVTDAAKVVTLGVAGLAVVATHDAVLVCDLDRTQEVKEAVARLKAAGAGALADRSRTTLRPWGGYTSLVSGPRFQVKHIFVAPGKRLSLQKHHHRSEHWIVVAGTAEVTVDGVETTVTENQSVYIPLGAKHRLANPGAIRLELIEIQTGPYLEEDDIVRFEDDYGRPNGDRRHAPGGTGRA